MPVRLKMKKCPYCAENIQSEAVKCKHCGEWLNNQEQETIIKNSSTHLDAPHVEENINFNEGKISANLSGVPIEALTKKYLKWMIVGFVLEYVGLLGIVLGNTGVISKDSVSYTGGAMIEIGGMIIILVSTYKLCTLLGFSLIKKLLISVINISIGINILTTFPYLIFVSIKIKDTAGKTPQSFDLKREDYLSVSQTQKSGGYVGGIILFFFYVTAMLHKQNIDDITWLSYFFGNIMELIGLIPLFMVYSGLRNRMITREWFLNKKWIASLIAGLVSLFLVSTVIVFVKTVLSRIK
jgi:hypothetical protein